MSPVSEHRDAPRVYLIEADEALRLPLVEALSAVGFEVEAWSEATRGIEAALARAPDLVLLGSDAAGSDSAGTCAELPDVPVVLLVREEALECVQRGRDAGAVDFQTVPCSPSALVERVRLTLAREASSSQGRRPLAGSRVDWFGVVDREQFMGALERALESSVAPDRHVAVVCLDLFQVKALRGVLSHESSKLLLSEIGHRLRDGVSKSEFMRRIGCAPQDVRIALIDGDEFTLFLPDVASPEDAVSIGKRVLEILTEPFSIEGQDVFITVSVGVATHPEVTGSAEAVLKCAQTAAYCARQQGHSSLLTYSPAMDARAFERLALQNGLRRALERDELEVFYQPRIEIATGRLDGFEALIRWRHPELGLVSPANFIPLAEETGLIVPIGEWVMSTACEQLTAWSDAGHAPVRVSVNLSAVQFRQPDLFEKVAAILERTGLDASRLELELTESLLMQNPESAVETLQRFSDHGISLSIDDFGTGYSSLSYLKRFPIDSLKIDQSFIRELTTNSDDAAIVTSIILMGKSLKLRVVAEGVETRSQLSFLRVMQCHEAQGYLFSRPVPAADAERFLRDGAALLEAA